MPILLQINTVVNRGSTGRISEEIGTMAQSHGWESYIAYGKRRPISKNKLIKIQGKFEFYWHVFMSRIFGAHGYSSKFATIKLIKKIKILNPDIIHLHNIHGYYLHIPTLFNYLSECQKTIVWTLHDCWPITGHCTHFVEANCYKWKTGCYECPLYKAYPKSLFFDRSKSEYEDKKHLFSSLHNLHIIPVSKWLEGILHESFLKEKDIRLIHNGINIEIFKPSSIDSIFNSKYKNKLDGKYIILGVASCWQKEKGLYDYMKLSKYLKDDELIVLLGVSKEIKMKLPNKILGIERTENLKELAQFYTIANVVTSLSYSESFGMTIIEAHACGTPVIAYNNTGQTELINKNNGILVDTGDIEGIYEAIQTLKFNIDNDSIQRSKEAHILYDKRIKYKEYIKLYENIYNNNMLE